jgi:hypothetical protein
MAAYSYEDLKRHVGHDIHCVSYAQSYEFEDDPENISVECWDCNEVLMDYDRDQEKEGLITVAETASHFLEKVMSLVESLNGFIMLGYTHGMELEEGENWGEEMYELHKALIDANVLYKPVCNCRYKDDAFKAPEQHADSCPIHVYMDLMIRMGDER